MGAHAQNSQDPTLDTDESCEVVQEGIDDMAKVMDCDTCEWHGYKCEAARDGECRNWEPIRKREHTEPGATRYRIRRDG